MVKKTNLAATLAAASALNMAAPATDANAALIESRTLQGDNGGTYTYQLFDDRLEFSLGFSDVFDMTSILFPFSSYDDSDMLKLIVSNSDVSCGVSSMGYFCNSNQAFDSFTGTFSFKPEFNDLYQFSGYNPDRNAIRTLSTIDGNFETFLTGTPVISQRVTQQDPVNASAPGTLGLLVGAGALALLRRKEKPQVDSKYNQF
ncbi:MAG: hypothetical protein VXZ40_00435 [Nanoarchaeota archaeon]|nr:hypothetical protein [Nanoarchaeota archaeon]